MKSNKIKIGFFKYISEMDKVFSGALTVIFVCTFLALCGILAMMLRDRMQGTQILDGEYLPMLTYIFRFTCLSEFFILLFDYASRKG